MITMILVGQYTTQEEFAAVSLGLSLANVSGHSVLVGLSSALATISSQAYGAGDLKSMNYSLWKACLVFLAACLPISVFWWYSADFLILCGQDASLSRDAGYYLRAFIPSLWLYAALQVLQTWLQTQGITRIIAWSAAIAAGLHPFLNWLLMKRMGALGSAFANALAQSFWLILLVLYVFKSGLKKRVDLHLLSWKEWKECLHWNGLRPFIKVCKSINQPQVGGKKGRPNHHPLSFLPPVVATTHTNSWP